MATLSVLKFGTAEGAGNALDLIKDLQKQRLITLQDAAVVTWPEGKKKPKTQQLVNMTGAGAADGAFWGLLFGLLFFIPWFGMAVGAAMGALSGSLTDIGIDDDFIKTVRSQVTEGTSALFLIPSDAVMHKVQDAFKETEFEIVSTSLSSEEEAKLKEAFVH